MSFFAAFRVVAWKACRFSSERFHLGPKFYCQLCTLDYKDVANGCPKCPLMELFTLIRIEETTEEIEARCAFPEGETIFTLTKLHTAVSNILNENKNRIDSGWSITFAELCRIILEERAQSKFERDFETYQKIKASNKK